MPHSHNDVYQLPPPHVASPQWHRLARRTLTRTERVKYQLTAVAFIFLLITGPVYWIHPPRFDLRAKRLAGRTGIVARFAVDITANKWLQGGANINKPTDKNSKVAVIAVKLPHRETAGAVEAVHRVHQSLKKLLETVAAGIGDADVQDRRFSFQHLSDFSPQTVVLRDESWNSAVKRHDYLALNALSKEFAVDSVQASCQNFATSDVCCGLVGELEYLLRLFHKRLRNTNKKSFVCIHHPAGVKHQDCPNNTEKVDTALPLMPLLSLDLPFAALQYRRAALVGHAHCGPLILHKYGFKPTILQRKQAYGGDSYCANAAMLEVLQRTVQHARSKGYRMQTACRHLAWFGVTAEQVQSLGYAGLLSHLLRRTAR